MSCSQKCECIPSQLIKSLQKKKNIGEIDLQGCNVEHLDKLNEIKGEIMKIFLSSNRIQNIESLPQTIIYLDISNNSVNNLKYLENLKQLKTLRCGNNLIENFQICLSNLELLDISNNYLDQLPEQIENIQSLSIFGNQFKNYEKQAIQKYQHLIILDGFQIKQSNETSYIIKLQEQQIAQKFQLNIDYLNKWRQELFKQLVQNRQLKILFIQHINQIKSLNQKQYSQFKFLQIMDKRNKQINHLSQQLQKCLNQIKREKQQKIYQQQLIVNSLKNLLDDQPEDDKLDSLIRKCSQFLQQMKLKNQQLQFQIDLIQSDNEQLKAQVDHFQQMYQQLKQTKNDEPNIQEKNKGYQQLYAQIRLLEEEKIKLQIELNNNKEKQSLELLQVKSQLEQQIALITQENQFNKQKLNINQEEIKIKIEQLNQQYDKKFNLQEIEHQNQCDKIRQDYQLLIENYVQKELNKNTDILKLKDIQNDLELQIKQMKQETEYQAKEFLNQLKDQQNLLKIQKDKNQDQQNLIDQLKLQITNQNSDNLKQLEKYEIEQKEIENQLQQTIFDQSNQIQDLISIKKQLTQQNGDLLKIIEMKDGVIKQLTLTQTKKIEKQSFNNDSKGKSISQQNEYKLSQILQTQNELEQKALQILEDDEF